MPNPIPIDYSHYTLHCLKCDSTVIEIDNKTKTATCRCGAQAGFDALTKKFRMVEKKRRWVVGEIEKGIPVAGVVIDDDLIHKMRVMEVGDSVLVKGGLDKSLRPGVSLRARIVSKEVGHRRTFMTRKWGEPEKEEFRVWRIVPRDPIPSMKSSPSKKEKK
jgi:hypothetical protein